MTPDQHAAIESLEAAVAHCSEVGVLVSGMDQGIYAYVREDLDRWLAGGMSGQFAHEITVPPTQPTPTTGEPT